MYPRKQQSPYGKSLNSNAWAVPSGGIEECETPEDCCVREVLEETGYKAVITYPLLIKETTIKGVKVKTHYYKVELVGESLGINDPDQIIEEVGWKSVSELKLIEHVYPEDVKFLENLLDIGMEAKPLG